MIRGGNLSRILSPKKIALVSPFLHAIIFMKTIKEIREALDPEAYQELENIYLLLNPLTKKKTWKSYNDIL